MGADSLGFKEWVAVIASSLVGWNLINSVLQARRVRLERLDGPRSDRTQIEDLKRDLDNMKLEMEALHKKASTLPGALQTRIGDMELRARRELAEVLQRQTQLEIGVQTKLVELTTQTRQGIAEHERYEFALQDITEKLAHLTGRIDAANNKA